jgi:hypothetical protein
MKTFIEYLQQKQYHLVSEMKLMDIGGQYYKKILKYKNNKDIYIHYTDNDSVDFSFKGRGKSWHGDPLGVYAFPIKFIFNTPDKSRMFTELKYAYFLQDVTNNKLTIQNEWMNFGNSIGDVFDYLQKTFPHKNNTRKLTNYYVMKHGNKIKNHQVLFARAIWFALTHHKVGTPLSGAEQTMLFLRAGYDAIEDISRNIAKSVITIDSSIEPQIIFLKRDAYKLLDQVQNTKINAATKSRLKPIFNRFLNMLSINALKSNYNEEWQRGEAVLDNGCYISITINPMIGSNININLKQLYFKITLLTPWNAINEFKYSASDGLNYIANDIKQKIEVIDKSKEPYKYWQPEDIK